MTPDASPPPPSPASPHISRRRLLLAGVTGVGLSALAKVGVAQASANGSEFNEPGSALEQATRITTTTTTTTVPDPNESTTSSVPFDEADRIEATVPEPPLEPLDDGQILFPVVAGEEDSVYVGDNFGACRSGCSRSHEGTDMMADRGLPIRAVVSGTLTKKYEDSGLSYGAGHGWTLLDEENDVTYKFFHMDHHAAGLEEGDEVVMGQIIGAVGNTGTSGASSDSNYHLHFEYRPNNVAMNSFDMLERDPNIDFQTS